MKIAEQQVTLIDSMGSDLSVVNAARVSFHKESEWEQTPVETEYSKHLENRLSDKDAKLIGYLARHGHWTPFAHAFLSFRIKSPVFVARQLVKHQVGLAWNEVSRRYVDEEPEFWFPDPASGWRGKPVNAKQGSSDEIVFQGNPIYFEVGRALECYKTLIVDGLAPELARMVLPQNMMTEWIWSGSLAAFARVCRLRLDPHAQAETREVAEKINDLVPEGFKYSWAALLNGVIHSRPDSDVEGKSLLK